MQGLGPQDRLGDDVPERRVIERSAFGALEVGPKDEAGKEKQEDDERRQGNVHANVVYAALALGTITARTS